MSRTPGKTARSTAYRGALTATMAVGLGVAMSAAQAQALYLGAQWGQAQVPDHSGLSSSAFTTRFGGNASARQDTQVQHTRAFVGWKPWPWLALEYGQAQRGAVHIQLHGQASAAWRSLKVQGSARYGAHTEDLSALIHLHGFQRRHDTRHDAHGPYLRIGVMESRITVDTLLTAAGRSAQRSTSGTLGGNLVGLGYDWPLGPGALRLDLTTHQHHAPTREHDMTTLSLGYLYAF